MKIDLCEWWTSERIAEEEAVWQRDRFFVRYASLVRDFMVEHNMKSVIEVGCGMGHVGHELKDDKISYFGTDGSSLMIQTARKMYPKLNLFVHNIRKPTDQKRDLVCSFAVLKHFSVADWKQALHDILKMGKASLIQVQMLTGGRPSMADDHFGPEVVHTWINEEEMLQAYGEANHKIVKTIYRDVSSYAPGGAEVLIYSMENK